MRLPLLLTCFLAFFLTACAAPKPQTTPPLEINADNSGQTITLALGQTLVLSLPTNAGTGFQWKTVRVPDFLTPMGEPEFKSNGQRVGAGGVTIWRLQATSPGHEGLVLDYRRIWEKEVAPAKTVRYTIIVRP